MPVVSWENSASCPDPSLVLFCDRTYLKSISVGCDLATERLGVHTKLKGRTDLSVCFFSFEAFLRKEVN